MSIYNLSLSLLNHVNNYYCLYYALITYALLNSPTKQNMGCCFAAVFSSNVDDYIIMEQLQCLNYRSGIYIFVKFSITINFHCLISMHGYLLM